MVGLNRLFVKILQNALLFMVIACLAWADPGTRVVYSTIHGIVQSMDPNRNEITLQHDAIPGYMGPMTMPFSVKDIRLLKDLKPHEAVIFQLVVSGQEAYVDAIVPDQKTPATPAAPSKPPDNARWL